MVPGHDLKNITTLRTVDDAQFIAAHANDKDVVIIGTSFIGEIPHFYHLMPIGVVRVLSVCQ